MTNTPQPRAFCRTWLFGPGADGPAHHDMLNSGADALIFDLEDFTPPDRRESARALLPELVAATRANGQLTAVRINQLDGDGIDDLDAAMAAGATVISLPMAETAEQAAALDAAMASRELSTGRPRGSIALLPVCETALGVANVRAIAAASARITHALLGAEDLAADLCADRTPDGTELAYARSRFLLECRAVRIEPIDAPYTYHDVDGAAREARASRTLGYRVKALVRADHARPINAVFTPGPAQIDTARRHIAAFEAARARGEDRAVVDGHWIEIPTYRSAVRLLEHASRLHAD